MKKYKHVKFLFICAAILSNLIVSSHVFAQGVSIAFGEVKSSGNVQVQSSTGKWIEMQPVYPLLQNTKLRTNEGIVFITTKEGSRIDISKDSEITIDSMNASYRINLLKGTITFNIVSSVSFAVITQEATLSVSQQFGGYYSLVAGPGAPNPVTIQGLVIRNDKGTFIRDISGKMNIAHVSETLVLNTGGTFFAAAEGHNKAVGALPAGNDTLAQGLITGAFFTTGTITAFEAFRGTGRDSPEGF
jgi:hypothetical protein